MRRRLYWFLSCQTCCEVGVDGFIIPDLPPEEADEIERGCLQRGLALIYMLAPTSTGERVSLVAKRAKGFIYLVSLTGVTGARDTLPPGLAEFVVRVRGITEVPLAVGCGISGPAQAREVSRLADGVVIGSAIIRLTRESSDPVREVREFVATLRQSIRTPRLG